MLNRDEEVGIAEVRDWLNNLRSTAEHREMIDLALLVKEISSRGESERTLCREIMESLLRWSDDRSETSFLSY